jgi:Tfp pilus assembly protein PilN
LEEQERIMRHNLAVRQPLRHGPLLGWLLVACALAGGIGWGSALQARLAAAGRSLAAERARVARLQADLREAERTAAPRRRAQAIMAALDRDAVDPSVIRRLEPAAPRDAWLIGVDLARGRLSLDGRALGWRAAAGFAEALARVPGLANVQLMSLAASGAGGIGAYDFHITADAVGPGRGEALP